MHRDSHRPRVCARWVLPCLCALACASPASAQQARFARSLSPLTPEVVARLRAVVREHPEPFDDVFSKIGDSATVNRNFMSCFGGEHVDLAGWRDLSETVDHFGRRARIYGRVSDAARVGWSASSALEGGGDAGLHRELRDNNPRFGLVMFGTNDVSGGNLPRFVRAMWAIVDRLLERGTIPVLSTAPPRDDRPDLDAELPTYNRVTVALARALSLPWIDLHRELAELPDRGLSGDGMHPNVLRSRDGTRLACHFTEEGLRHGNNVRNLLNLMMLDRLRRAVLDGEPAPDVPPPVAAPARAPAAFAAELAEPGRRAEHPGCGGRAAAGPRRVHRVHLAAGRVSVRVVSRRGEPLSLRLLDATGRCLRAGDETLEAPVVPGPHDVIVEGLGAGEYLLLVD